MVQHLEQELLEVLEVEEHLQVHQQVQEIHLLQVPLKEIMDFLVQQVTVVVVQLQVVLVHKDQVEQEQLLQLI
jgi:hypothetical protein